MTAKVNPTDAAAVELVERFINFVLHLKATHRNIKELFVTEEDKCLMEKTANLFFLDMQQIFIRHFLLESVKITDRQETHGKENFSIKNIIATVDWPDWVIDEIDKIKPDIDCFIEHVKPARNKILAHYDKETFLANGVLGYFPIGCDDKFVEALEKMCNDLSKASSGKICGDLCPQHDGDVLNLKKMLKKGIAFEKLWRESSGEEKHRLNRYLKD